MSQHARIEEVSDSDPDSDPSEMDPSEFASSIIRPANIPPPGTRQAPQPHQTLQPQFRAPTSADTDRHKHWQCLYPVYFDATRTRAEGRRVGKALAVENPLAREIVDAVAGLGLDVVFEPGKMHPKDWGNPGRVRILLKEDGVRKSSRVKNSTPNPFPPTPSIASQLTPNHPEHHLYTLVAHHLQSHPTTADSPLRLRIQGMPLPDKPIPPPAVPRGWKMGTILPLHSPALSGGGVSENIIKDMMQEMQGVEGAPGVVGGEEKRVGEREKKKGKKK